MAIFKCQFETAALTGITIIILNIMNLKVHSTHAYLYSTCIRFALTICGLESRLIIGVQHCEHSAYSDRDRSY